MQRLCLLVAWTVVLCRPCQAQRPAFSGAEGPGATATGGRGGDVYHVTNLEFDVNGAIPGSLRYGLNTAPASGRTIVFDVGGTIFQNGGGANSWLRSSRSNITVAGQTAPGPGVTIAGVGSKWSGTNVILRNLAIRPNKDPVNPSSYTYDAFSLQLKNSIVDHVTSTWHTDEGISLTDAGASSTVQYSLIGEGLNYGGHSFGSIIATETDGTHYSYNHNLYAHNAGRLPAVGSEGGSIGAVLAWSNNVIYNWPATKAGYVGGIGVGSNNWIGNFYVKGPSNGVVVFKGGDDPNTPLKFYQTKEPSLANKSDFNKDGDLLDGVIFGPGDKMPDNQSFYTGVVQYQSAPLAVEGAVPPDRADVALQRVLDYGGAHWNNRPPIDQRIVNSVRTGTGAILADLTGATQAAEWASLMAQRPVGGVAPFSRLPDWDGDGDGIPRVWEERHGLDPSAASNNGDFDADGYTNLEEYLNETAEWPAPAPILFERGNSRYAQIQNWRVDQPAVTAPGAAAAFGAFRWQPSKYDTAVINHGTATVDAVGQHAGNLVLAMNPGDDATLNISGGWIVVEDAPHGLSDGITVIGDSHAAAATLNLTGGRLITKTLLKGAGGTFNFTGGALSAELVGFPLHNDGGAIAPGNGPGRTRILDDLTISSGALQIEIAGTGAGQFDSLVVDGAATLGGTLLVSRLGEIALGHDVSLTILDVAGTRTGQFDGLAEGALVGGFGQNLFITYAAGDGNDVALYTTGPGDFDGDRDVDGADLLAWQRDPQLGALADWKNHFGASAGQAAGAAVPEPRGELLGLLLFALVAAPGQYARRDSNPQPPGSKPGALSS